MPELDEAGSRAIFSCATEHQPTFPGTAIHRYDGFAFCMSGPNSAKAYAAYARTRRRTLEANDLVMMHCNSYVDGFWTDITRTYTLQAPDRTARKNVRGGFCGPTCRAVSASSRRPSRGSGHGGKTSDRRLRFRRIPQTRNGSRGWLFADERVQRPASSCRISGRTRRRHGLQRGAGGVHRGLRRSASLRHGGGNERRLSSCLRNFNPDIESLTATNRAVISANAPGFNRPRCDQRQRFDFKRAGRENHGQER